MREAGTVPPEELTVWFGLARARWKPRGTGIDAPWAAMGVIKQWFDESGKRRGEYNAAWKKRDAELAYGKIAGIVTRSEMLVEDVFAEWHANYLAIRCSPS